MKQQLNGMYKQKKGFLGRLSDVDKAHNTRIAQCLTVLDRHMVGNRNFIIHVDGKPAGMMSMSVPPDGTPGDDGVKLHGLMSLPGTKGVGRKAIEQAVQLAMREGREGRVDLEFLEFSNSHDVYKNFGFRRNGNWDSNSMYLSPPDAKDFLRKSAGRSPSFVSTGN
ncbi:GNAT family N-acetyltransferase [Variovorax sp. 770b2]|uniref:GNAT family N-acetyltransferase n=1 Tax=Variovorax sp. 770b2 TaxID=1566271 RepID=UPI001160D2E1|nr:GNAT family N-acetyltransferase [Variovorax sp. 770b2]